MVHIERYYFKFLKENSGGEEDSDKLRLLGIWLLYFDLL